MTVYGMNAGTPNFIMDIIEDIYPDTITMGILQPHFC